MSPGDGSNGKGKDDDFKERYSGRILPGQTAVEITFSLRRGGLGSEIKQNHGNQEICFELLVANGIVIAVAENDKIERRNLAQGNYVFRVRGNVTKAVDFTIKMNRAKSSFATKRHRSTK